MSRAGLETLLSDPYPLARLIGACALARTESRGAHVRADHPESDPRFDSMHSIVEPDATLRLERWL